MQYLTDFSTASKRLNFNNTVQAKRSAVTEESLYQRPEGTRHLENHSYTTLERYYIQDV